MTTFTGKLVSVTAVATVIKKVKSMGWKQVHAVTPRLLPSSKNPVGWLQGHAWVEGEIRCTSKDDTLDHDLKTDAMVFSTVTVVAKDVTDKEHIFELVNLIVVNNEIGFDEGEPVTIYHFLAYSVEET